MKEDKRDRMHRDMDLFLEKVVLVFEALALLLVFGKRLVRPLANVMVSTCCQGVR
jgi:hypothetical protein